MLRVGLSVSVHSDDPAYFGGYVAHNLACSWESLKSRREEIVTLVRNGIEASWLPENEKTTALESLRSRSTDGSVAVPKAPYRHHQ